MATTDTTYVQSENKKRKRSISRLKPEKSNKINVLEEPFKQATIAKKLLK